MSARSARAMKLKSKGGGGYANHLARALPDFERHGIALEVERLRLACQRSGPGRMAVAKRRDRVATVEIEYAPAIARVQPDTFGVDHRQRVLRKHRRQEIRQRAVVR